MAIKLAMLNAWALQVVKHRAGKDLRLLTKMAALYVSIDGDDVGRLITSCYLDNDIEGLKKVNAMVNDKTREIELLLRSKQFEILFRAADGVSAISHSHTSAECDHVLRRITTISAPDLTFSVGVGSTLRQSYVALLKAKSSGKARVCKFEELQKDV